MKAVSKAVKSNLMALFHLEQELKERSLSYGKFKQGHN